MPDHSKDSYDGTGASIAAGGVYPAEHSYRFAPGSDGPTDYSCGDCGLPSHSFVHVVSLAAVQRAFKELDDDGHQWSTRPCETCFHLSTFLGEEFGCVRLRRERNRARR